MQDFALHAELHPTQLLHGERASSVPVYSSWGIGTALAGKDLEPTTLFLVSTPNQQSPLPTVTRAANDRAVVQPNFAAT